MPENFEFEQPAWCSVGRHRHKAYAILLLGAMRDQLSDRSLKSSYLPSRARRLPDLCKAYAPSLRDRSLHADGRETRLTARGSSCAEKLSQGSPPESPEAARWYTSWLPHCRLLRGCGFGKVIHDSQQLAANSPAVCPLPFEALSLCKRLNPCCSGHANAEVKLLQLEANS